jgi:GNAT superfamily N-acetyltransferase
MTQELIVVEGSLEWSSLNGEDLGQLAELREAIDYFDDPIESPSADQLARRWRADQGQPGYLAVVGRDQKGGTVVAYGWLHPKQELNQTRLWLDMGVHPAWRHNRIGRKLLAYMVNWARKWRAEQPGDQKLWMGYLLDEKFTGLGGALGELGFKPDRWYFDAHLPLNGPLPEVPVLRGVRLVHPNPDLFERLRLAHNEIFAHWADAQAVDPLAWRKSLERVVERPELSWVLMDGEEVAGYALNSIDTDDEGKPEEGWTERFGVRRPWRRNGYGTALLLASQKSFAEAGLKVAGIGVDTDKPQMAESLISAAGYASEDAMVRFVFSE